MEWTSFSQKMPPPGRRRQSRRETDDLVQLSLFDGLVGAVEDVLHGGVQILLAHAVQGGLRSPDLADGGVGGADDLLGQNLAGRVESGSLELLGGDVVGGGVVEGHAGVGLVGIGGLSSRSRRSGAGRGAVRAATASQQAGGSRGHSAHAGALEERTAGNAVRLHFLTFVKNR